MHKKILTTVKNSIFTIIGAVTTILTSITCYNSFSWVIHDTITSFKDSAWLYIVKFFPVIASIGASVLIYYYFDDLDLFNKRDYFEKEDKKALISEPQYLVPFVIGLLFSRFFFTTSINYAIADLLPESQLIAGVLSVLTFAAIRLIQLHLLKSKWDLEFESPIFVHKAALKRNRDMYTFKPRQLILQPLGFLILYGIALSFSAKYIVPIFISLVIIIKDLWWGFLPIIPVVILIPLAVSVIRGLRARRKLIMRLNKIEKLGYAKIKYDGRKYLSALFPKKMFSFELEDSKDKKYNTVVISCGKMNSPIYFKESEFLIERGVRLNNSALMSRNSGSFAQIVDVSKMGGDQNPTNALAGYYIVLPLDFPDREGERSVIINPIPTKVYVMDNLRAKSIDTGEKLFDYTVYNTTGFCNMIERDND